MVPEKTIKLKEEFIAVCNNKLNQLAWNDVDEQGNAIRINEVDGGEFYYRLIIDLDAPRHYLKKYSNRKCLVHAELSKDDYLELLDKIIIQ